MLYVDRPNVQIYYNQVLNCTVHTWKGYFLEEEYQATMQHCLELIQQTGTKSLIVNLQAAVHEYWLEGDWTADQWFPELAETDLQKLAIVVKQPQLTTHGFYFYSVTPDRFVISRYFDRLEDAQNWIAAKGV